MELQKVFHKDCQKQGTFLTVSSNEMQFFSKAEGISRLVYPALPPLCKVLFKFIWRGETEHVKRKTIIRSLSEGG